MCFSECHLTLSKPWWHHETGKYTRHPNGTEITFSDSLVSLGKFGAFPARYLLNLPYDITYEIIPNSNPLDIQTKESSSSSHVSGFGELKGKKSKKGKGKAGINDDAEEDEDVGRGQGKGKGKGQGRAGERTNPGWGNMLRPLKRQPIAEAVVGELYEVTSFVPQLIVVHRGYKGDK